MDNTNQTDFQLSEMKELTTAQYDKCREQALKRVQSRIGDKPSRNTFQREFGRLWSFLDILALVVFSAALAVSSVHIIQHMSKLSADSYVLTQAGIIIGNQTYAVVHQIGFILLAEASMLLFMIMHAMNGKTREHRPIYTRWISGPLLLALVAMIFVIVANWQSNIGLLEAIMPPIFTIGLGLHFEKLIVEGIRRKEDVTARYLRALEVYEIASADPTKHPDYKSLLAVEIWQKLISLKVNEKFGDAPTGFKKAAVYREIAKDQWAENITLDSDVNFTSPVIQPIQAMKMEYPQQPVVYQNVQHMETAENR